MNTRWLILAALVVAPTAAQPAVLHLKNGQSHEVIVLRTAPDSLEWRLTSMTAGYAFTPYGDIDYVEFDPPPEWLAATRAQSAGRLAEAIQLYKVIQTKRAELFYPVVGNFVSLAQRRLLECYRALGDGESIAALAKEIRPETLPVEERALPLSLNAWVKLGMQDWEGALALADRIKPGGTDAATIEACYIRGMALRELGNPEAALRQLAKVYTLNLNLFPPLAERALRASIVLLADMNKPNRQDELEAQVRVYAALYGDGKLWPEAPPELVALVAKTSGAGAP